MDLKVIFRLFHLPKNIKKFLKEQKQEGIKVDICLLGSIAELGEWDLENKLTAEPSSSDGSVWEVMAQIPAREVFDMAWLVVAGGEIVCWDPADDHSVRLSYHDTTVQVSWGRDPTYSLSRTSTLSLETEYFCAEGQALAVVGSDPCLGSWDPQNGVLAQEYPRGSGHWQVTLQVADGRHYEWKWVVVDCTTKLPQRWEESGNRYISTNCERVELWTPWNSPTAILKYNAAVYRDYIDMRKVAKFYDCVEKGESLVTEEMREVTSSWKQREETEEKPFVVTETERRKTIQQEAKKLKERRSFIRKIGRAVTSVSSLVRDFKTIMSL